MDEVSASAIDGTAMYRALGREGTGDTIDVSTVFAIGSTAYQACSPTS